MRTEKLSMSSRLLRVREFTDQVARKTPRKTGSKTAHRSIRAD